MASRNPLEGGGGGGDSDDGGSADGGTSGTGGTDDPDDPLATGSGPDRRTAGSGGNDVDDTADGPSGGGTGGGSGGSADGGASGTGGTDDPDDPLATGSGPDRRTVDPRDESGQTRRGGRETAGGGAGGTYDPNDPLATGSGPDRRTADPRDEAPTGPGRGRPSGPGTTTSDQPPTGSEETTDAPPTDQDLGPMADWKRDYAEQFEMFGPGDVRFRQQERPGGEFAQPYIPEQIVEDTLQEDVASQSEYVDPEDVEVSETDEGGFEASVPESAILGNQREELRGEAAEQYGVSPSEVMIVREGDQLRAGVDPDADVEFADAALGGSIEADPELVEARGQEAIGQTTDPTYDPDADQPAGLGEVAVDVAEQTVDDPVGYVGGGAADFATTVGGDIAESGADSIDSDTAERVAGVETAIPQGAVEGLQEAGAFVARGEGEDVGGPIGEFQEAGGLHGIGETFAAGFGDEATEPVDQTIGTAADLGVPGAERTEQTFETTEQRYVEPAAAGVFADLPATIAEAPGSVGALSVRAEQTSRTLARDPGAAPDIVTTAAGFAGVAGVAAAQGFAESPVRSTGRVAGEVATGAAAIRTGERLAAGARGFRTRARADETVDFEDITSERGAQGDLPQFQTSSDAPTARAVGEVRQRAGDTPDVVEETLGAERALYHSTRADLGRRTEVGEGRSELPGLFTSPDASPLRLAEGAGDSGIRAGLPRLFGEGDRIATVPGERIEGMPSSAAGSGRVFDSDAGEYRPDPEASGYQFLMEEADPGVGYVRPTGGRTTELEAIVAPGTQIERTSRLAVRTGGREVSIPFVDRSIRLGGRTIPMDVYRFGDTDASDAAGAGSEATSVVAREVAEDFAASSRRASARQQTPVGGPLFAPSRSGGSEATRTTTGTTNGGTTTAFGTEPTASSTEPTSAPPTTTSVFGEPTTSSSTSTTGTPTDTPGTPGSSGSSPSSPGSGGGSPTGGFDLPDFDSDPDDDEFFGAVAGGSEEEIASFVDPLTGELDGDGTTSEDVLGW